MKYVLAIETSCDDTSVALVDETGFVSGLKTQNQDDTHAPFGGVIPELACRNHTERLLPILDEVMGESGILWDEIMGIAVTNKPGLIGSLLVGVITAKTLSMLHKKPIIGVNHLEGHLHAPLLKSADYNPPKDFKYPFVGLCVSGGHTSLYQVKSLGKYVLLGRTLDDAAGEAFDKFGKLLGLGYPAGAKLDQLAREGRRDAYEFPRPLLNSKDLNMSFSGLKTSGSLALQRTGVVSDEMRKDFCASYQEAIVDVLIHKLNAAVLKTKLKRAVITGGVSANSRLRARAHDWAKEKGVELLIPPLKFCTDNAAMIGLVGLLRFKKGERHNLKLSPEAYMKVSELV